MGSELRVMLVLTGVKSQQISALPLATIANTEKSND